jgi:hypothetical protein
MSVWHRDPHGSWIFYTDVVPRLSCNRYFGSGVDAVRECPIEVSWTGPFSFSVNAAEGEIDWQVEFQPTPVSRLMSLVCDHLPERLWRQAPLLAAMGEAGGRALRAGKINLHGQASNGQGYVACPLRVWTIPTSCGVVDTEGLGEVGPFRCRLGSVTSGCPSAACSSSVTSLWSSSIPHVTGMP